MASITIVRGRAPSLGRTARSRDDHSRVMVATDDASSKYPTVGAPPTERKEAVTPVGAVTVRHASPYSPAEQQRVNEQRVRKGGGIDYGNVNRRSLCALWVPPDVDVAGDLTLCFDNGVPMFGSDRFRRCLDDLRDWALYRVSSNERWIYRTHHRRDGEDGRHVLQNVDLDLLEREWRLVHPYLFVRDDAPGDLRSSSNRDRDRHRVAQDYRRAAYADAQGLVIMRDDPFPRTLYPLPNIQTPSLVVDVRSRFYRVLSTPPSMGGVAEGDQKRRNLWRQAQIGNEEEVFGLVKRGAGVEDQEDQEAMLFAKVWKVDVALRLGSRTGWSPVQSYDPFRVYISSVTEVTSSTGEVGACVHGSPVECTLTHDLTSVKHLRGPAGIRFDGGRIPIHDMECAISNAVGEAIDLIHLPRPSASTPTPLPMSNADDNARWKGYARRLLRERTLAIPVTSDSNRDASKVTLIYIELARPGSPFASIAINVNCVVESTEQRKVDKGSMIYRPAASFGMTDYYSIPEMTLRCDCELAALHTLPQYEAAELMALPRREEGTNEYDLGNLVDDARCRTRVRRAYDALATRVRDMYVLTL